MIRRTALIALLSALLLAGSANAKPPELPQIAEPEPAANRAELGKNIPRTMKMLATSTQENRIPVRILFYGQSITVQRWWRAVAHDLKTRFPNADLSVENLAIGGFGIPRLRETAEHDVYPYYPDLIVLHAYGVGKGNLDSLVGEIRRRTTAEIVLWTHHVCTRPRRAGQDDAAYEKMLSQHQQRRSNACKEIRRVAEKYACELVEVRDQWEKYLKVNKLEPKALLGDHIHLNEKGWALMATLMSRHFRYDKGFKNKWSETITTHDVKPDADGRIKLTFTGNRIDAIAKAAPAGAKLVSAKVLIDGKAPSEDSHLYAITRPSKAPNAWYPAITRIDHVAPLLLETWTLRITKFTDDAKVLSFEVSGSKTGPDGAGISTKRFTSKSGRVVIDPKSWMVAGAIRWFKKPMPKDYAVTWQVVPRFVSTYQPPEQIEAGKVHVTALAKGLTNGKHTLEIIPDGKGSTGITSLRVHCPPLRGEAGVQPASRKLRSK